MSIYEIVEDKGDNIILRIDGSNDLDEAKEKFKTACVLRDKKKLRLTTCIEVK